MYDFYRNRMKSLQTFQISPNFFFMEVDFFLLVIYTRDVYIYTITSIKSNKSNK